jgi:hypothetical protein
MVFSDLFVVSNAMRLRRLNVPLSGEQIAPASSTA